MDQTHILFSVSNIESAYGFTIPSDTHCIWVDTPTGKEKYLTFMSLKEMWWQLSEHNRIDSYLNEVFRESKSVSDTKSMSQRLTELDDTSSICSYNSDEVDDCMITAMRHRIDLLEHQLQIKSKDQTILEQQIALRDKEIELLRLRLSIPSASHWI